MNGFIGGIHGSKELSKGLDQLKKEHPPLIAMLDEISALTEKIDEEIEVETNFSKLKEVVSSFKIDLDPHSEREEGVLFPMMGQYIGTTSGPIVVMEYEHDQAKKLIGEFLSKALNGELLIDEKRNLSKLVKEAYDILIQHFYKEENVLFPMAERMLSEEEKEELYNRIQEIK